MKYIKQKSNGKALHREVPHSDQAIVNASRRYGVDVSDLEVAEENWSEEDWITHSVSYQNKRLLEYPSLVECVHAILDGELDALQAKRKLVKDKYPKE